MPTLKFIRKLAQELDLTVDELDDHTTEYVLGLCNSEKDLILAAKIYRETQEDQVNP